MIERLINNSVAMSGLAILNKRFNLIDSCSIEMILQLKRCNINKSLCIFEIVIYCNVVINKHVSISNELQIILLQCND